MRNVAGSQGAVQSGQTLRFSGLVSRAGLLLVVLVLSVLVSGEQRSDVSRAYPYALSERQRYGFVATSSTWRDDFEVTQLGAGWYMDANPPACATRPGGMDRALMIKIRRWLETPAWPYLDKLIAGNPGSLWLVGNEPDCVWQDDLRPEEYAEIYYDIYWGVKQRDPTALVSPGGIVQPTPLRLEWLDRVLLEYAENHPEAPQMPVDVWNIHNAILNEGRGEWGADIPPGFDEIDVGVTRTIEDHDRLDIFEAQIWTFRQWMEDRGYGDKPLMVSEFGILLPVEYGFDMERVNAFMDATFEFFATAADGDLGDPNDGDRLVQRWAWFSLDNPPWDINDPQTNRFNGNLFNPYTTEITGYGLNFATHTSSLPPADYMDLRPGGFRFEPLMPVLAGETVNRTVEVEVRNLGSQDSGLLAVRLEYAGPVSGQLLRTIPNLPAGSSEWIAFELAQLSQGVYDISAWVDPDDQVSEVTDCDNELEITMVVPTDVTYFPLAAR